MTTFITNPGVERFETQGPNGILRVEADSPLEVRDLLEVAVLEAAGAHAISKAPRRAASKKAGDA